MQMDLETMADQPETLNFDKCDIGHPSEDVWDKFEFDLLTPPHSPEQTTDNFSPDLEIGDLFSSEDLEDTTSKNFCDLFINNYSNTLPELKDTICECLPSDLPPLANDGYSKIRQDCMWNGRNEPRQSLSHRQSRSDSPTSLSSSLGSGCIDPEHLFNSYKHMRANSPRRLKAESGPETPSDSDEEVDVVSVEKKTNSTLLQPFSNPRRLNETKVFGTMVQQNVTHSHVALISSTNNNGFNKLGNKNCAKSAPRTLSVFISNEDVKPGSKRTFQLKCLPFVGATVTSQQAITKPSFNEKTPGGVLQLMRLTPTSVASSEKENTSAGLKKSRLHSLDGVSMISDTGIKRRNSHKAKSAGVRPNIKTEPLAKLENNSSALLAEMKKTRKSTKRSAPPEYDSPTSSPGSCSSGDFSPPKRRNSGGRSSGSSSGSDEEIRMAHNVLERQRREGLRNLYHVLQRVVPEVSEKERVPKVTILTKAKEHVHALQEESAYIQTQKKEAQQNMHRLQQRLHNLVTEFSSPSFSPIPREIPAEPYTFVEAFISN